MVLEKAWLGMTFGRWEGGEMEEGGRCFFLAALRQNVCES